MDWDVPSPLLFPYWPCLQRAEDLEHNSLDLVQLDAGNKNAHLRLHDVGPLWGLLNVLVFELGHANSPSSCGRHLAIHNFFNRSDFASFCLQQFAGMTWRAHLYFGEQPKPYCVC